MLIIPSHPHKRLPDLLSLWHFYTPPLMLSQTLTQLSNEMKPHHGLQQQEPSQQVKNDSWQVKSVIIPLHLLDHTCTDSVFLVQDKH